MDAVFFKMEITGWNADKFAWADPPIEVSASLQPYATVSRGSDGRPKLQIASGAPTGEYDFTLVITVDGQTVRLDPELDVGMVGA